MANVTTESSWFDRLVTRVADPNYDENMRIQAENEASLEANRQRLLNSGKLTSAQTTALEAQDLGVHDTAAGEGKIFADEYKKEIASNVSGVTNWVGSTIWKAIPLWVWLLLLLGLAIYFKSAIMVAVNYFRKGKA